MVKTVLLTLCLTLLCLVSTVHVGTGWADAVDEQFRIHVDQQADAVKVVVEFDHPTWGWVEAGFVEFTPDGRIVLKVRGEQLREITDLGQTLSELSTEVAGDEAIGRELALNIERRVQR